MLDTIGDIFGMLEFANVPFSSLQSSCVIFGFLMHQEGFSKTGRKMYRKIARNLSGFRMLYLFLNYLIQFLCSSVSFSSFSFRRFLLRMPLSSFDSKVLRLTSL